MKNILIMSCSVLALSAAAAHAGNFNQSELQQISPLSGSGNNAVISQTGDFNIAGSNGALGAGLAGDLRQNGDMNDINVDQDGHEMVRSVRQIGNFSKLDVNQSGNYAPASGTPLSFVPNHRVWNVRQTSSSTSTGVASGDANDLDIDQIGEKNVVGGVKQNNTLSAHSSATKNVAVILQDGNRNGANIGSVPPGPAAPHGSNLIQDGHSNDTNVNETGDQNNFKLASIGNSNIIDLDQTGNENYTRSELSGDANVATYIQYGNSNDIISTLNSGSNFQLKIGQWGNSNSADFAGAGSNGNIYMEQNGMTNSITANSSGVDQHIAVKQIGDNNSVDIAGLNGPSVNKFYVLQDTSDNTVTVGTVDGSYNRLQFIQTGANSNTITLGDVNGSSNKLFFTQDGEGNLIEGRVGDIAGGQTGSANRMQVSQLGDFNITYANVDGNNNNIQVQQGGDSNMADVSQSGNGNSANVMQGAAALPTIHTGAAPFGQAF